MEIGIYGLGRMGGNMAVRLARGGHRVVAANRSPGPVDEAVAAGAIGAYSIEELVAKLGAPRVLWSMVPAGAPTDEALEGFAAHASPGDVFVDGGNSNFRDSMRRAERYGARGFRYLDIGVSGGIWGLKIGYCMMVGGPADAVEIVRPLLDTLAPRSWLLELAERAFEAEGNELERIKGYVEDSGEGRWTIHEAIDHGVPMTALAHSLFARFASRQQDGFALKVAAALRNQFGGHQVKTE